MKKKETVLLESSNLELLTKCVSEGMAIKDICLKLKISKGNFYYMWDKHKEFKEAYYAGLRLLELLI